MSGQGNGMQYLKPLRPLKSIHILVCKSHFLNPFPG